MMQKLLVILLAVAACAVAHADVWRWVDAEGDTHFVDTKRPIYTWRDDSGKYHYADKPDHPSAVSVELVWHSAGSLEAVEKTGQAAGQTATVDDDVVLGETAEDREQRRKAEAYYCKRATDIYNSYLQAPRLYKTNADGEKVYLSDEEAKVTLDETKAKVDELCR